jgi:hypothetical protein
LLAAAGLVRRPTQAWVDRPPPDPHIGGAGGRVVTDNSLGLPFFLASAIWIFGELDKTRSGWLVPPWGRSLMAPSGWGSSSVVSGALQTDLGVRKVGLVPEKAASIAKHNQNVLSQGSPIKCFVVPGGNLGDVPAVYKSRMDAGETLEQRRDWKSRCYLARTATASFSMLACPDVPALISHLNPWSVSWIALRLLALGLPLAVILLLPRPVPPQFRVEHSQPSCSMTGTGFPKCVLAPGRSDELRILIRSSGDGQEAELTAEANQPATLSYSVGELPQGTVLPAKRVLGAMSLFFTMPANPPEGGVTVFVGVRNRAGKQASQGVWYAPEP